MTNCGGILGLDLLNGCKLTTNELISEKTVIFHSSDLIFENGRPVRTKRSYRENKRPKPPIVFQYIDTK